MRQLDEAVNRRLAELMLQWEDSLLKGVRLSSAELCKDCPELTDEFEFALSRLHTLDQFMFPDRIELPGGTNTESDPSYPSAHFPSVPGYDVLAEIGEGGMGIVYLGRQKSLKRDVAIKTLTAGRWNQSAYVDRLRREAKGLSQIDHPNVVKIIDVVETPAAVAIILEYVEGENLANRLKRAAMPPKEAGKLALELARTMAFVHQRRLWHRDIKPANILIDLKENIKVADFGLVKEEQGISGVTGTGDFFGTPSYMAPEQIPGSNKVVDGRTDVYAIGATLYEMLSGRPPFVGVSPLATLEQVQVRDPVPLSVLNPAIPRDLETICLRCLEKEPARRFHSAQDLADELERFLEGIPILSRRIGVLERCWRWTRRRPAIASLAVVSLVSLVAIMTLIALNIRSREAHFRDQVIAATRATELQHAAEGHARQAKDGLYIADINRAGTALSQDDTRELMRLLDAQIPVSGETDRRGFEWWHLYRRARRARQILLDVGSPQYLLGWSPRQELLFSAGADSILRLFHPETGHIERQIPTAQLEINGVAFSPDGKEFATAGDDGTIIIWDQQASKQSLKFKAHPGKVFQLLYTADGARIVSCGDNPVIRVFDAQTGELLFTLDGHQKTVQSLILSDDGLTLVSTSDDHSVRLWSLDDRKELMSFVSSSDIGPAILHEKRNLLVFGDSAGDLTTIDTKTRTEISSVKHLDKIGSLALHPAGKLLAVGDASGQIRLRSLSPDGELKEDHFQPWHAHQGLVYSLIWSTDGSRLISTGNDGKVVSWNLADADTESAEPKELRIRMYGEFCLRPETTTFLVHHSAQGGLQLNCWDWKDGRRNAGCAWWTPFFHSLSCDGRLFTVVEDHRLTETSAAAQVLCIYSFPQNSDPSLQDIVAKWEPGKGELRNIRFSSDSKSIAVSRTYQNAAEEAEEQAVWLLPIPDLDRNARHENQEPPDMELAQRIPIPTVRDSRFSPDSNQIALVTQPGLVLWDISERQTVWQFPDPFIRNLAYSPDGSLIAICGTNRMVHVVNAVDGSTRFQSANHRAPVRTVAFSPGGRLLATGADDGTIKFWHVTTGQELLELQNPGDGVRHLEFTDDGDRLICQLGRQGTDPASSDRILIFDGSRFEP